ncbi:toprim domain-containing protein [Nocardia otitidiscaviarum]|uniref:Toprim domain-containing protein n=1 Tax=Nocardia otitidiscaviarum TaxID=1823 RepID=A0A516NTM1_9NOCA|nr:toprim domain-containing protein [Nocardia otitidiscaviarum]MCP9621593.1 toprim domain-containing protein [Nocardia otitidiscaviarum]QDP82259.1 toprim domain-containing protein [Nocardia otitidiscaviarum]
MEPQPTHGRSWELITSALTAQMGPGRAGPKWTNYYCPVHENDGQHHNPSLGVRYDPAQGKTILRCWAGCDDQDVLSRLNLRVRDMWDQLPQRDPHRRNQPPTPRPRPQGAGMSLVDKAIDYAQFPPPHKPQLGEAVGPVETVCTYVYRWPDGRVEGAVARQRTPHQRGYSKGFWQARWTGNQWEHTGFAPIPYRLPELVDAVAAGREIYVCEGEKDVVRAFDTGQIATCNAMGAGSWTPEHARWLHGAGRVIVVADRDRPGYRHAARVAETLHGHVGEIRVLQAAAGKDLSDHLDAGHGIDALERVPYLDRHYRQPPQRTRAITRSR